MTRILLGRNPQIARNLEGCSPRGWRDGSNLPPPTPIAMRNVLRVLIILAFAAYLYFEYRPEPAEEPAQEASRGVEAAPEVVFDGRTADPATVPVPVPSASESPNASGLRPTGGLESCTVERIIDGDTIHCPPVGRIRLIGIDTPERGQKPFGPASTEAITAMIPIGSTIDVEFDVDREDRYDRVLGYLWANGELVNWRMVREGWALMATYPPNVRYTDHYLSAQQAAREDKVGLWAVDGFACEPAAFRRGDCG
jgi:micrococcal nuclease